MDLEVSASNSGAPLATSTATLVATYTLWHSSQEGAGSNGTSSISGALGHLDVDPKFTDPSAGNYRPRFDSPVTDHGNPAAGGPATDRDGNARVFDGDAVAGAVRDPGAYELVDLVPPHTFFTSGPSGPTNDATPTFGFSSEPGATFLCLVDNGIATPCSSPFTTTQLGDGPHQLRVVATDLVGQVEAAPASRTFTVDTVAPDTLIGGGPTGLTRDATPTFGFASPDAGATLECKVDGAAYVACAVQFTSSQLGEGAHTFSVRAKDAATNVDATPATRSFTVDTVGPETTLTKKPPRKTTHARIKVRFPWVESGAGTFECRLDQGTFTTCTSPYKVKVKVGKHTIEVRAIDAAGNVDATPAKVKFKRIHKP